MIFSCPVVGASTIIANFQSICVNLFCPEFSIPLYLATWVQMSAMDSDVTNDVSATLVNDSWQVQLSCWLHS